MCEQPLHAPHALTWQSCRLASVTTGVGAAVGAGEGAGVGADVGAAVGTGAAVVAAAAAAEAPPPRTSQASHLTRVLQARRCVLSVQPRARIPFFTPCTGRDCAPPPHDAEHGNHAPKR